MGEGEHLQMGKDRGPTAPGNGKQCGAGPQRCSATEQVSHERSDYKSM